jgi:hypothetical protein
MSVKKTKTEKDGVKGSGFDGLMQYIIDRLGEDMKIFRQQAYIRENLTPKERSRLIGAGIRNYGFIEKTNDIGKDNPAFLPSQFDMDKFSGLLHDFDIIRQIYFLLEKFESLVWDSMLLRSSDLYRDALRVYNGLKEQAKGRVPGAKDLFDALEPFFKRRKGTENQLTQKEELRKLENIAKGATEGEVLVRNIKPKTTGGVKEIIEDIGKERIEGEEIRN